MTDIPRNDADTNFLMIGLHKLAAERGDGLVPELMALYEARRQLLTQPMSAATLTLSEPEDAPSTKNAGNDNVIPFKPYLVARKRRR